jgi:hypothetical protein
MKLALISGGLFLVTYIAVNRGLGPQPLQLVLPLLIAFGTALAVRWVVGRGRLRRERQDRTPDHITPAPREISQTSAPSPPRSPGGKARKLF